MSYTPTIGLEVHAELKTKTKMFCNSLNDPDEKHPNTNVCPVCLGHPGTLPTINKEAVEKLIKVGLALNGKINPITKFDRKNYFYPDLPKGYQISQYDQPIVIGGELNGVRLTRVHLEEDAGRLVHGTNLAEERRQNADSRGNNGRASFVDFNRAGVPLMELVTEPVIKTAEEAGVFARELQLILRYLGASDADMEKGQMRLEANVSLRETADERGPDAEGRGQEINNMENVQRQSASSQRKSATLGTKVEVKNINSFKALEAAIAYEIKRQEELLEKGEKIKQETRGWDDIKQRTVSQRSKEEAHDYRYFPDPDLPPFETSVFDIEKLKYELPELPNTKRERFSREYGLDEKQTENLIGAPALASFFEEAVSELGELESGKKESVVLLYNYLTSDLVGLTKESGDDFENLRLTPEHLAHLVALIDQSKIASRQAKDILRKMVQTGADPEDILEDEGLHTVKDEGELKRVILEVLSENEQAVADYKKGKTASLQFLIGKAMAKLRGRGEPETLRALFSENLK